MNLVFKFKITLENEDDIFRIIEIGSNQSFLTLHKEIQNQFKFDGKKEAAFFKASGNWRKLDQIDDVIKSKSREKNSLDIHSQINDPHQKFIYVFDPEVEWTFFLELLQLRKAKSGESLPSLIKTVGVAPKQYKNPKKEPIDPSQELFEEADDIIDSKSEFIQDEIVGEEDQLDDIKSGDEV